MVRKLTDEERWLPVVGYEGFYIVSSLGRVRLLERSGFRKNGRFFYVHSKIKKPYLTKFGYYRLRMEKNKHSKHIFVHRLVAEAFIPNPENKPEINHKNGIRTDNRVKNLEWCTQSENNLHSYRKLGRIKVGLKGENNPVSKIVLQIKNGIVIAEFCSVTEAQTKTGIARQSIGKVANKKLKSAGGYKWEWKKR